MRYQTLDKIQYILTIAYSIFVLITTIYVEISHNTYWYIILSLFSLIVLIYYMHLVIAIRTRLETISQLSVWFNIRTYKLLSGLDTIKKVNEIKILLNNNSIHPDIIANKLREMGII